MEHIQNFLDIYRAKHKDFSKFPEVIPQTIIDDKGEHQVVYLDEQELLALYLAVDELMLYNKSFLDDESSNFHPNYIYLILEKNKHWIDKIYKDTPLSLDNYIMLDFALAHPSRFVFNNIKHYFEKDVSITFSDDLKSYQIQHIFAEPEQGSEYSNPHFFYQACLSLQNVSNDVFEKDTTTEFSTTGAYNSKLYEFRFMELFALALKENLLSNAYYEKNVAEKTQFIFENLTRIIDHAQYYGAEHHILQSYLVKHESHLSNKEDAKIIMLLAMIEHIPEFVDDLNRAAMVRESPQAINYLYNGYVDVFINYATNYEANPFFNSTSYRNKSYNSLTYLSFDNNHNFLKSQITPKSSSSNCKISNSKYFNLVNDYISKYQPQPIVYHNGSKTAQEMMENNLVFDTAKPVPFFQMIEYLHQNKISAFSNNFITSSVLFKALQFTPPFEKDGYDKENFAILGFKDYHLNNFEDQTLNEFNEKSDFISSITQNFNIQTSMADSVLKAFGVRDFNTNDSVYSFNRQLIEELPNVYPKIVQDIQIFKEMLYLEENIPTQSTKISKAKKF